jgi:1-aminocyclopropane-1-carboxylate deaminase/D-cysteine desulfhydrase-like pyridoxal-dependent ACC family enzyme
MGGNAGLGEWVGIERILLPDGNWDELYAETDRVEERLREEGASVYRIPIGGSSVLGGYGFYLAGRELDAQCRALDLPDFDVLFTASSSGSTHTGLMMSLGDRTRVIGIACDPEPAIAEEFAVVGRGLGAMLELPAPAPTDYELDFGYVGPGYGVPSDAGNEAIRYLARREGIFLDPIYSGKAFSGLMARAEEFKGRRVLFWHTGGTPALFVGDA